LKARKPNVPTGEVEAVVLGLSPLQYDFTPDVDALAIDPIPYLVYLSTEINEKGIGYLLKKGKEADPRWQTINYDQRNAVLNLAYQLIQAMQFEIIGADDADPDPLLAKSKIVVYNPGDSGKPTGTTDSEYVVQYHPKLVLPSGAHLVGTFTEMAGTETVNLTVEGATDWTHYASPDAKTFKASGPNSISGVTGASGAFGGAHQDGQPVFVWSDGSPTGSGSDFGGYYAVAGALQISLPASTTSQHLRIYIGVYFTRGRLTAHLGDSSAPDYTDASLEVDVSSGIDSNKTGYYDILFAAGSNTTLTITYSLDLARGNVHLHAATLNPDTFTAPAPLGGGITLNGENDIVVASENGGFHADAIPGGYNLTRVAPTPAVHLFFNGTEATITDSTEGGHRRRDLAVAYTPPTVPITPPQPCNCDTGGSKPPPSPPPAPVDIPTPTPPSKQSWTCADLINDAGIGATVTVAGVVGVGAKYYEQNNTALATLITTVLTAELSPALQGGDLILSFDMRCSAVMQISPFTLFGLPDPLITRPTIVKIDGSDSTDYYYFQRAKTETILPGPLVHDVYDGHPEKVTVGPAGYLDWAFNCAYIECEIARAFTNLLLQFCGAEVKYWEPLFFYPFNGTEQVLSDGMHDVLGNYTIPFDTGAFLDSNGYPIMTDQVHGFTIHITPFADAVLRSAKTTAVISGHIKSIPGGENNDTNFYLSISGGGTTVSSAGQFLAHTDDKDFSFTVSGTFAAGTEYIFILSSDSFANGQYYLTNLRGALT